MTMLVLLFALQDADVVRMHDPGEVEISRKLDGIEAMTVGAWVRPNERGEQLFFSRGTPERGPNGERMFRPNDRWLNFLLGTDHRGFLMGTIHGNGTMPFPFVTLNRIPIGSWSHVALAKDAKGFQKFYLNGTLVCSDDDSCWSGKIRRFQDLDKGDPVRLAMGREGWVFARELSAEEIRKDFESTRSRYAPVPPAAPVRLLPMDGRPGSWKEPVTAANWPKTRERIQEGVRKIFGPMPTERVPLDPKVLSEEDCGSYRRRKVSLQVQAGDRMPAYLLIPKTLKGRVPAIVCFYGTTNGAGKETTVGLSGGRPGTPPEKNRAFAVDMVEAGFVAFAADYLRDGERISPGKRPYDTTEFYAKFPDWSIHGKDAWDTMRAIDYLQSLDFIDPDRIGMVGHSYGGHSTIFTAAMEPRIKAAWANGPVSDFVQHGMHWATPKGGGSSQSLPAMRPYLLDRLPPPITFYEVTALIAPRALAVGQAVGERRPMEEENCAAVSEVYRALGAEDRVSYVWYPGDHDFPPHVRKEAVAWFTRWLREPLTENRREAPRPSGVAPAARVFSQGQALLSIGLVTKDEKSAAVQSLRTLWGDRLRLNPEPSKEDVVLVLDGDPKPWIDSGATVVLDLPLFAAAFGGTISSVTLENPNRLPIDPYDIKAIEAAGREYGEYLSKKTPPSDATLAIQAGLKAEIAEPIPSVRITRLDPALRGFAVGDIVPWCGHRKGQYRQRTMAGGDAEVLAASTVGGGAVIVRRGNVYGVDLDLEEPNNVWDNRGAFHKWVPLSNLAGPGVRAGRYWPKKPNYAGFAREVRAFASAHPEWVLDVIGRRGADEIHRLTLGDPTKPLYVFIGMPHAEDEWVPALGSLSFAELLSRERNRPEVKARFDRFSVRIYPLIHPATYESPLFEPGKGERDVLDREKTKNDRAYSITQLHQGGDVLVPACGTPTALAKRIAERAKEDFAGRHVWWAHHQGKYGPQAWESTAPVAEMPPSWSAYWWQDGKTSCYGLYPHDVVFGAKAMYFIEQDFIGFMPERFTQANAHHALHRMLFEHASVASLLLTDQTANWCLSILLTDHGSEDRDPEWRPTPK